MAAAARPQIVLGDRVTVAAGKMPPCAAMSAVRPSPQSTLLGKVVGQTPKVAKQHRRWIVDVKVGDQVATVHLTTRVLTKVAPSSTAAAAGGSAASSSSSEDDSGSGPDSGTERDGDSDEDGSESEPEPNEPDGDALPADVVVRVENAAKTFRQDWRDGEVVSVDKTQTPRWLPSLRWDGHVLRSSMKSPLDYFLRLWPEAYMPQIVAASKPHMRDGRKDPTVAEYYKMFGCFLAMTLVESPDGTAQGYWKKHDVSEYSVTVAPNFGRFMTWNRNRELLTAFRLCADGSGEGQERWMPLKAFVAAWNTRRVEALNPGWKVCVDESVSAWRGLDGTVGESGMPHVTKIARKPKGVGCEIKNAACAISGMMMTLEIV
jgi:hypothetical protein